MKSILNKAQNVVLPISGYKKSYIVNHIYCIGRNYRSHAIEMGEDHKRSPFVFTKPKWALTNQDVVYPSNTEDLQHEVELVLAMGNKQSIFGYAVGVDLTRRDIQNKAKSEGKPWFRSKCFAGSAPISGIVPIVNDKDLLDLELKLEVNGTLRQSGLCGDMIWSPLEIIREMSNEIPLVKGDLIFTGTPDGVNTLIPGDEIVASISNTVNLTFSIT